MLDMKLPACFIVVVVVVGKVLFGQSVVVVLLFTNRQVSLT